MFFRSEAAFCLYAQHFSRMSDLTAGDSAVIKCGWSYPGAGNNRGGCEAQSLRTPDAAGFHARAYETELNKKIVE